MTSHAAAVERQAVADALLRCGPWYCTHDDEALCSHAEAQARHVAQDAAAVGDVVMAYQRAARRVERHQIAPPEDYGHRGGLARMGCPLWWRRQLRRLNARRLEQRARVLGRVSQRAGIYCSNGGYRARREQQARNLHLLETVTATNQDGQVYTLAELAKLGMANPDNRRAELMLRIADTETEARRLGHVSMFYTLTCPSRMHPVATKPNLRPNPRYDGTDPREAQAYLNGVWRRTRAKLAREGIGIYGIRVVEPHHDGTPHWHLLLFMEGADKGRVTRILRDYACEADAGELRSNKARRARFDSTTIDYSRGTAAGYVAKYVCKNVNGRQFCELDHYGQPMHTSAPRIEAWASTWGIRQFQFVGLPSVTVWRELRRLDADIIAEWEAATRPDPEAAAILGEVHRAADAGLWDKFLSLMGGPMAGRLGQPIKPWRVVRQSGEPTLADVDTGELTHDVKGRYGEPVAATWGVTVTSATGEAEYLTRRYRWDITAKAAPIAVDLERLRSGEAAAPWTRVNNCTLRPAHTDERRIYEIWEQNATAVFRRMFPPLEPGRVAEIQRQAAIDAEGERRAAAIRRYEHEDRIAQRAAHRQRCDELRPIIAGWLLDGHVSPEELNTTEMEILTT